MAMNQMDGAPITGLRCLLLPQFNTMSLNAILEPARVANYLASEPLYETHFHSVDGDLVPSHNGMPLTCTPPPERVGKNDLVLVFASWGGETYRNPKLMSWCRLQIRHGATLVAVELAAYVLARAGLLAGRRATAQWSMLPGLREQFPDIEAVEQLYTADKPVMTCAGGTAGIDLMLTLIGEAHGPLLAGEVADQLLHHPVRPAETPQRSAFQRGADELPAAVRDAVELIQNGISDPLTVPEIASAIGLSQRQLERRFAAAIGCTVVQFSLLTRLQHARVLLISTHESVREIATASGFNSLSHFAFAFKKCFGKRPSAYRQAWPKGEPEPRWPGTLSRLIDDKAMRRRLDPRASRGLA